LSTTRRKFLEFLGKGSVFAAFIAQIAAAGRALLPNVLYEPSKRFKIKRPDEYAQGYTFDAEHRLFVIRQENTFHVISAVCTHLGCTVQWRGEEFACPCHGSIYNPNGKVIGGPAPRPLAWYDVVQAPDGRLEVDTGTPVPQGFSLTVKKATA